MQTSFSDWEYANKPKLTRRDRSRSLGTWRCARAYAAGPCLTWP
jgi:hypothetical protein